MFKLALSGVRHNVGRYVATLVAIMTGVAFFSSAGFLSARVIDALEGDVGRQYRAVDAAVVVDDSDPQAGQLAEQLTISGDDFDAMAKAPGVEGIAGTLTGPVVFQRSDGTTFGTGVTGRLWVADEQLNPVDVVEGKAPAAKTEVAVDRDTAESEDLAVGSRTKILGVGGGFDVTVTGITEFGNAAAVDSGGTVSLPEELAFDLLTDGKVEYQEAFLRGSGSPATLVAGVEKVAPKGFVVQTGDAFRADKADDAGAFGRVLKTGLQFFALLALLVGGFVIYNTFTVIIAQRQRELAVLSAIGATPKQLKRSLRFEGVFVGLIGSALGVLAGFVLTFVLMAVLGALGISLPGSGVKVTPGPVIQGLLLGTIITVASVMIPARRAAKIEPIEALREAAVETGTVPRRRKVTATVLVLLGLAGLFGSSQPAAIGLGALLLAVGVIIAAPQLAIWGAHAIRPLFEKRGLEGQLAVDNSIRNPKRTATTSNALLIGVFLVTFVTVAGTSLKDFAVREIQKLESADFVVASQGGSLDDALLAKIAETDGVESVSSFRRESVTIDGEPAMVSTTGSGDMVEAASLKVSDGSIEDLKPGTIAVAGAGSGLGASSGDQRQVGDTVTVANTAGKELELTVAATLEANLDQSQIGDLMASSDFDELVGPTAPTVALVDAADGAESDTEDALKETLATRPDILVIPGNAIGKTIGSIFDFLINAINGLLLMSVIVALIGIVNTLSLSIIERRRELGLLRIIGMTDTRVQRMVRLESAFISGLGTVSGIGLGLLVGSGLILAINRSSEAAVAFSVPWPMLGLILLLGVTLGVLASIIPARRSTRLEVLDAIAAT